MRVDESCLGITELIANTLVNSHQNVNHLKVNIGAFCQRMRENRSVRLQMADLLRGCEFCHGFYEKYGLIFCWISQNSC